MSRTTFMFQGMTTSAKVSAQEIQEISMLIQGLWAFQRVYCTTHSQKNSVLSLVRIMNEQIADHADKVNEELGKRL